MMQDVDDAVGLRHAIAMPPILPSRHTPRAMKRGAASAAASCAIIFAE